MQLLFPDFFHTQNRLLHKNKKQYEKALVKSNLNFNLGHCETAFKVYKLYEELLKFTTYKRTGRSKTFQVR